MHRVFRTILLASLPALTLFAQDGLHTSTITLSAGGEVPTRNDFGESSGPVFSGNYEFRILKYLSLEAGVNTMLPKTENFQAFSVLNGANLIQTGQCAPCLLVIQPARTRVTLVPFGLKAILPVRSDRVELFAGGGGAYAFHADFGNFRDAMLIQANLGGRVALDQGHHFWLGTSGHFYSNFGSARQEWATWSADFGIRFGR